MKNKIKWYSIIAILCIVFTHCSKMDEYMKYMPDGEIIYPQKPDSVKTFPGKNRIQLEWVIIDPKVSSCQVLYEQGGIQGSTIVEIQSNGNYTNDTIRVIIPDLEETTYAFKIVSYDAMENASITVETEESSYGEMYESSLPNRSIKSAVYDADEGLQMEWYDAEDTEIGINLDYTDINGHQQTMIVDKSETSTIISDFDITKSLYYSTLYKPVPSAIDIFYAQTAEKRIPYWVNITADVLKNTEQPFTKGDVTYNPTNYHSIADWTVNDAAGQNGIVNESSNNRIDFWVWPGASISPDIINGKMYQTIELEAGTYRFNAVSGGCYSSGFRAYIVADLGNDLPNIDDAEQALGYAVVPSGIAAGTMLSFDFVLTEKRNVSLGFVVTLTNQQQVYFEKVELWAQQ